MADTTGPAAEAGATAGFEERWRRATQQPELVSVEGRKVEIDLSPAALLSYLREVAEASYAEGEMGEEEHKSILEGSKEIERVLGAVTPERLQQRLKALKPALRARFASRDQ
jgi:hypothetical protein